MVEVREEGWIQDEAGRDPLDRIPSSQPGTGNLGPAGDTTGS